MRPGSRLRMSYSGLKKMINLAPMTGVSDRAALSAKLLSSDMAVPRWPNQATLSDFSKQSGKGILFTQQYNAVVADIVAAAETYGCKELCYNVEGVSPAEVQSNLEATFAAVRALSQIKLTFGTIYSNFLAYYDNYAPFCNRQVVQLQQCWKGTERALTQDAIDKIGTVNQSGLIVQICCYTPNVHDEVITAADVAAAARSLETLPQVAGIWLYFATGAQYGLAWDVVQLLRVDYVQRDIRGRMPCAPTGRNINV